MGTTCGPGVSLVVRDSGTGMTPDVQAHMFEPFFTTKGPGKGTGLGLATVYGIVKQSGGYVSVESELGHGTTFMIWLPRVENPTPLDGRSRGSVELREGRETILLVEDEDGVRELAREVLQGHGYTVIEARDGESALRIVEHRRERLHLLLTDVVMPKMGGRELVRCLIPPASGREGVVHVGLSGWRPGRARRARARRDAPPEAVHAARAGRQGAPGPRRSPDPDSVTGFPTQSGHCARYSITLSARTSTDGGMVIPSAFAAFRFITNSNLVGNSTGRSAGLAPFRILSTKYASRRKESGRFGP